MTSALDLAALSQFAEAGFVVRERLVPEATCDSLIAALSAIIERVAEEHLAGTRRELSFWKLLPASAHGVEVFFDGAKEEQCALAAPRWEGRAMRVGHGLHLIDPTFAALARSAEIAGALAVVSHVAEQMSRGADAASAARIAHEAEARARIVQSAVIYKQPMSDTVQFGLHRDSAYLPSEPESLVLAFLALDATTRENGCLEVIPGSHTEPLGMRLRLDAQGFTEIGREPRPDAARAVALPLSRGSVAFVHGRMLHASAPNRSTGPRRALIVHAIHEASALSPIAWVKEPEGGFAAITSAARAR